MVGPGDPTVGPKACMEIERKQMGGDNRDDSICWCIAGFGFNECKHDLEPSSRIQSWNPAEGSGIIVSG